MEKTSQSVGKRQEALRALVKSQAALGQSASSIALVFGRPELEIKSLLNQRSVEQCPTTTVQR